MDQRKHENRSDPNSKDQISNWVFVFFSHLAHFFSGAIIALILVYVAYMFFVRICGLDISQTVS